MRTHVGLDSGGILEAGRTAGGRWSAPLRRHHGREPDIGRLAVGLGVLLESLITLKAITTRAQSSAVSIRHHVARPNRVTVLYGGNGVGGTA
eukprot:6433756-Prymnesium_polylepis.1